MKNNHSNLKLSVILLTITGFCPSLIKGTELSSLSTCTCLGYEVIYECTVSGGGATSWEGTALESCSQSTILLRHSEFNNSNYGRNTTCGTSGHIYSCAVSSDNGVYTSQLILNVSNDTVGDSIECSGLNDSEGVESLQITLTTAPPPAPGSIELSHITNGHMTFIWEPINRSCPAVSYLVNASDCGECPSVTTSANITCYTGSLGREQVCAISVQTVLCGNIIGNHGEISRFILRGYSLNSPGSRLILVEKANTERQLFLELNTSSIVPEMYEDGGDNSTLLNVTITPGESADIGCSTAIHVDLWDMDTSCIHTYELSLALCPFIGNNSWPSDLLIYIQGGNKTLVQDSITELIDKTEVTSSTPLHETRENKQNGIIIGVGSAFLFVVIALIVSIILTSAIVCTKIRKNKCDNFQIGQEGTYNSVTIAPQIPTSGSENTNIQQATSNNGHDNLIVETTSESVDATKEVIYADIGPSSGVRVFTVLDDAVQYAEIVNSAPDKDCNQVALGPNDSQH